MGKLLKGSSGEFKQPDVGSYPIAVVHAVDIGTQPDDVIKAGEHSGTVVKGGAKVLFNFELLTGDDSPPVTLIKEVRITFGEKSALTGLAKAFLGLSTEEVQKLTSSSGKGLDFESFLGKTALGYVGTTASGKAKLESIVALPKGMTTPAPKSELLYYDIDDVSDETFSKLPKIAQEKILNSAERKQSGSGCLGGNLDL